MSSPLHRNRREADPAIADALSSVFKNQKFKRMMAFSIKSLSEFCVPPNNKYKENALSVVEKGAEFRQLLDSITLFSGDEEVLTSYGRIFFGISEGLKDDGRLLGEVQASGMSAQLVAAMSAGVTSEEGIVLYLDALKNLNALNVATDTSAIVPGLLQALKPKMKSPICLRVLKAIENAAVKDPQKVASFVAGGVDKILNAVNAGSVNQRKDSPECVVSALNILKAAAKAVKMTAADLDKVITLLDNNKNNAAIQRAGSACIASMINPEDLKVCLATLKSSDPDSPERAQALIMLSSMSYISSCADEISKSGSIPLIVDALREATTLVANKAGKDAKANKSLAGTAKVLSAVAKSSDERKKILGAKGLEALVVAAKTCTPSDSPEGYLASVHALSRLCEEEETHAQIEKLGLCEVISQRLDGHLATMDQKSAVLPCSAELINITGDCEGWIKTGVTPKLGKVAGMLPDNHAYHESVIGAASALVMKSAWAETSTLITGAAKLLADGAQQPGVAKAGNKFLENVVKYSHESQAKGAEWGPVVEAALTVLLEYSESNPTYSSTALSVLEALATESDVRKTLSDLDTAVMSAKANPTRCLRCLAAVNGLSQLSRLRPAFETQNAFQTIISGMKVWVETPQYDQQQKIIKYGCQCLESLTVGTGRKTVDTVTIKLLETLQLTGMKTLRDKQDDPSDNSLTDVARTVETLCAMQQFTAAGVDQIVDGLLKCIRKYPESRHAQISFMNCLHSLVTARPAEDAPEGSRGPIQKVIDSGILKSVLTYMGRVSMYQDVQLAGCKLLLAVAQSDERSLAQLKGADALPVVQVAQRTHRYNKELNHYCSQLIGLLIPEGELERIITENCKEMSKAWHSGSYNTVIKCFDNINAATIAGEGARVAARCDLGKYINETYQRLEKVEDPEVRQAIAEKVAISVAQLTQKQVGVQNLLKNGGVGLLKGFWESLGDGSPEAHAAILSATKRLLQKDRNQSKTVFEKGWVPRICAFAAKYEEDADVTVETAGVMAALTPQKELLKYEEYKRWLANLCKKLNDDGPLELKAPLIEATENILLIGDDQITEIFLKNKGLKGVLKCMDDFPHEWPTIKRCNKILDACNRQKLLRTRLQKCDVRLPQYGRTVKRIMQAPKIDADVVANTLRNYNEVITPADTAVFEEVDLLPEIENIMVNNSNNELLMKACGDYLGKVGCDQQIDSLFKQIVDQCDNKPAAWTKNVTNLNNRLAVFLIGKPQNSDKAFQHCSDAMDKLATAIKQSPNDVPLFTSVGRVVRRMVRRSVDDPATPYGIPALKPKLMPAMVELLSKDCDNPKLRPRLLLIDGFHGLADMARFPDAQNQMLEACRACKTVPQAEKLLKVYASDPEVCAAVLDFLAALASFPEGAELIQKTPPASSRRIGDPALVDDVMGLMKRFNKNRELMDNAFELLGNMGKNQKQAPAFLADAGFMKDLNDFGKDAECLPGLARMHKALIGKEPREATAAAVKSLNAAYEAMVVDPMIPDDLKADAAVALAEFIAAATAFADLTPEEKKGGGVKDIIAMFDNHKEDIPTLVKMTRAVRQDMVKDADASAKLAHGGIRAMLEAGGPEFQADALAKAEMLALIAAVASGAEGQARALGSDSVVTEFLQKCEAAITSGQLETEDVDVDEMKILVEQIRRAVNDDQPEVLTLEKVYGKWKTQKDAGEELLVDEHPIVVQHLQFVLDYTEEYGKEPLSDVTSGLGLEFAYGCKCFQLLFEKEANCAPLNERSVCQLLLNSAARQRNEFAVQCAMEAVNDAVQYPGNAEVWAMEEKTSVIVADVLNRGRTIKVENAERESMLRTRLEVAERVAINRTYFNNTECMNALVGLWDDFDAGKYSVDLLKAVFKAMRRIINDHWVAILLKHNVPQRLIDVVNDKSSRIDLLPDVLFLLAALAVVPEIKTLIGDLKGVEACIDLLVRSMKNPDHGAVSAVLTNDCLALSAITMGHGANLQRFVANKGVELNIQAMGQTGNNGKLDYDVANAASLLMCNTCFKRDEMKEMYGKLKACESVMRTINQYDGAEDAKAFRCLATMFKAIGNLALWTPNVEIFMTGKIHNTFAHLYEKSDRLPDTLIEASLRTLSNLAMENTSANMISFGVTMKPILYMLTQEQRCSIRMFTLAFDVLGCLCRHPDNSKKFLQYDGIKTCLRILNSYSDAYMYANGIHVLGIQTTNPASVPELVSHGVFDFLTAVLENQAGAENPNNDLAVSGCRCIRRLLTEKKYAKTFIQAGGLVQIVALMKAMLAEASMVHLECHRTILNLLTLYPPPAPKPASPKTKKPAADDWDDEVADEGVLPTVETMDRPGGPRSWEMIEYAQDSIKDTVVACVKVLDREENLRQNRLVRACAGVLAYFACEKIPGIVDTFHDCNFTSAMTKLFSAPDMDEDVIKTGCYVINNVAYASEPEKYLLIRKDRDMRKNLDMVSQKLGGARPFCELTLRLLNERSADPARFEIHQQWTYPLELTQWNKDKYPNGVQDLPLEWKEELRAGGKLKTIVNGREKEILHWKSSMDLEMLQWRVDPKDGPMKHSIGVSRICSIARGLKSSTLQQANEQGSPTSKPREGESIVLRGLPCEDFPNGVELNILCGTKRARDKLYELLTEWREAVAFGF